jgi:hypothetical protein
MHPILVLIILILAAIAGYHKGKNKYRDEVIRLQAETDTQTQLLNTMNALIDDKGQEIEELQELLERQQTNEHVVIKMIPHSMRNNIDLS